MTDMTLTQVRDELRRLASDGGFGQMADAIDAHLAKAAQGEAVAWQKRVYLAPDRQDKGGWSEWFECSQGFAESVLKHQPNGRYQNVELRPLYAAPPTAVPAQTVEAVDEHTSFEDSCRARGLSFTRNEGKGDDYSGPHIQAMWDGWCDRAALANPRPSE